MITTQNKALAIARIKYGDPLEVISLDMDIPILILKEWENKEKDTQDLVVINANNLALTKVLTGDVTSSKITEEVLKAKIEETATQIVDQVNLTVHTGDLVRAKTLQLCADTITKLYIALINKSQVPIGEVKLNNKSISAFQALMKE